MDAVRRRVLIGALALALALALAAAAILTWRGQGPMKPLAMPPVAAAAPAANADASRTFKAFLAEFRVKAGAIGIGEALTEQALGTLAPDPEVLEFLLNQPEIQKTAGEYVTALVSEARIEVGRQKARELEPLLDAIERRFGVDRYVVLAIWGVESNFGTTLGSREVVRSLATLAAFDSRRGEFWRSELLAMLRILQSGAVSPVNLLGSWAGGMGHTQFIPSAYLAHAIDFDNDGRRDIWGTVADALGSTANYLKNHGWSADVPWGFEVRLPAGFDYALSGSATTMKWSDWQAMGLVAATPPAVADGTPDLQLLLPAGVKGPAFLIGGNFQATLRYNNATAYALAVGLLSDRIAGRPAPVATWPADERGLTRPEREEVQRRLGELGFLPGTVDGLIGVGTRIAIRMFQKTRGLPADGHADLALLQRLRQETSP